MSTQSVMVAGREGADWNRLEALAQRPSAIKATLENRRAPSHVCLLGPSSIRSKAPDYRLHPVLLGSMTGTTRFRPAALGSVAPR